MKNYKKMAKSFLHDLSNEDFLGLTCDIVKLIGGLVRLVRNESAARNINPTANTGSRPLNVFASIE